MIWPGDIMAHLNRLKASQICAAIIPPNTIRLRKRCALYGSVYSLHNNEVEGKVCVLGVEGRQKGVRKRKGRAGPLNGCQDLFAI